MLRAYRWRVGLPLLSAALTFCLSGVGFVPAMAQQTPPAIDDVPLLARDFKEKRQFTSGEDMPTDERKANAKYGLAINTMLAQGKFTDDAQKKLFNEYTEYAVARLTWKENWATLPAVRTRAKTQSLSQAGKATDQTLHKELNERLFALCKEIIDDEEYHPVVRYNCLLSISYLDEKEPGPDGKGAIPFSKSLDECLRVLDDRAAWPALRVGGMVGIARYVQTEMLPEQRGRTVRSLLGLVNEKLAATPTDVQIWLHGRAGDLLAVMGARPDWVEARSPDVVKGLGNFIGPSGASVLARCEVTKSLGLFDKGVLTQLDGAAAARNAALLAIDAVKKMPDEPARVKETGNALTYYLSCVYWGLNGYTLDQVGGFKLDTPGNRGILAGAKDPKAQKMVRDISDKTKAMIAIAGRRNFDATMLAEIKTKFVPDLEKLLAAAGGPATPLQAAQAATGQ